MTKENTLAAIMTEVEDELLADAKAQAAAERAAWLELPVEEQQRRAAALTASYDQKYGDTTDEEEE